MALVPLFEFQQAISGIQATIQTLTSRNQQLTSDIQRIMQANRQARIAAGQVNTTQSDIAAAQVQISEFESNRRQIELLENRIREAQFKHPLYLREITSRAAPLQQRPNKVIVLITAHGGVIPPQRVWDSKMLAFQPNERMLSYNPPGLLGWQLTPDMYFSLSGGNLSISGQPYSLQLRLPLAFRDGNISNNYKRIYQTQAEPLRHYPFFPDLFVTDAYGEFDSQSCVKGVKLDQNGFDACGAYIFYEGYEAEFQFIPYRRLIQLASKPNEEGVLEVGDKLSMILWFLKDYLDVNYSTRTGTDYVNLLCSSIASLEENRLLAIFDVYINEFVQLQGIGTDLAFELRNYLSNLLQSDLVPAPRRPRPRARQAAVAPVAPVAASAAAAPVVLYSPVPFVSSVPRRVLSPIEAAEAAQDEEPSLSNVDDIDSLSYQFNKLDILTKNTKILFLVQMVDYLNRLLQISQTTLNTVGGTVSTRQLISNEISVLQMAISALETNLQTLLALQESGRKKRKQKRKQSLNKNKSQNRKQRQKKSQSKNRKQRQKSQSKKSMK